MQLRNKHILIKKMGFLMIILIHQIIITLINTSNIECRPIATSKSPKFSAILVFGDSTMDSGNNNYIHTVARADFGPYGNDFPGKIATGRFSDGKLIPDFLASYLGIKEAVPAFLNPKLSDDELITGVNFASAASGYDELTGAEYNIIPVLDQIDKFRRIYIPRLNKIVGPEKARSIINEALVIIGAGTNDVSDKAKYNNTKYYDVLLNKTQTCLKELYNLGCRSMLISGLPPLGCLPCRMNPIDRKCLEGENVYAESYNQRLIKLLSETQEKLLGSRLIYVDVYGQMMNMINNPQRYGFVDTSEGCCGTGDFEMAILCNPVFTRTCGNESQYLFFDAIHPSQACYFHVSSFIEKEVLPKFL